MMELQTFADGQTFFNEGDRSESAFVIESGQVAIDGVGPAASTIATLEPGEILGEMGQLPGPSYEWTASWGWTVPNPLVWASKGREPD